jgi:hypothetical protein
VKKLIGQGLEPPPSRLGFVQPPDKLPATCRRMNRRDSFNARWSAPHYSMRLQMRGQRMAFSLGTGNAEAAARSASNLYSDFLALGVEGALAKYRPQKAAEGITTVGEWIEAARSVATVNSATFALYAAALRKIVGDIRAKRNRKRFGPQRWRCARVSQSN